MSLRDTVRDAQRRLAELDAAHRREIAKLDRATARRREVLSKHDTLVASAQADVDQTVVAMATEIGIDLTSSLLGLNSTDVRHLVRSARHGSDDVDFPRSAGLTRRVRPDAERGKPEK
jgi:hypothetical protein